MLQKTATKFALDIIARAVLAKTRPLLEAAETKLANSLLTIAITTLRERASFASEGTHIAEARAAKRFTESGKEE